MGEHGGIVQKGERQDGRRPTLTDRLVFFVFFVFLWLNFPLTEGRWRGGLPSPVFPLTALQGERT